MVSLPYREALRFKMLKFRWIETREELERLTPVFESYGWSALNPYFAKALVAEDEEGKIVGFNVLQLVARPEPLWVEPRYRGRRGGVAAELANQMSDYLKKTGCPYWAIQTESPAVMSICEENGMTRSNAVFYEGRS